MDGKGTKCRRKIAENYNCLSRVHERYRRQTTDRQTDGRATAYSEREREFTFAKNQDTQKKRSIVKKSAVSVLKPEEILLDILGWNVALAADMDWCRVARYDKPDVTSQTVYYTV